MSPRKTLDTATKRRTLLKARLVWRDLASDYFMDFVDTMILPNVVEFRVLSKFYQERDINAGSLRYSLTWREVYSGKLIVQSRATGTIFLK
jgi:hypothetical protein